MKQKVAFIGVGTMGRIMLERAMGAGYSAVVVDPSPAATDAAGQAGAEGVRSPREAAERAKWIVMSLPAPRQVQEVLHGEDGLLQSLSDGHIVVDTSTVDPSTSEKAAEACRFRGAFYLDAPVLGRPASVGKWVLPVGGDGQALDRITPLLETFAARVVHVGASGSGHAFKLLNQLMFSAINGITAEVFAVADKVGISRQKFYEVISSSGAATVSGLFLECGRKIVEGDYQPVFSVDLLCKDAGLGLDMATGAGAPPIISTAVQMCNRLAQAQGMGSLDTSALARVFGGLYARRD